MPKPCGDFFLPKSTLLNHSRQIQKKMSPLPLRCFQVLVNNEVPMHFYIKRFSVAKPS